MILLALINEVLIFKKAKFILNASGHQASVDKKNLTTGVSKS